MKATTRLFLLAMFISTASGCAQNKRTEARKMADRLMEEIGEGTAAKEFSEKYFTPQEVEGVQTILKESCDFKHRQGKFISDWHEKKPDGMDQVSFIYEFILKCDSLRIIATYNLGKNIELSNFKGEKLSERNPMLNGK